MVKQSLELSAMGKVEEGGKVEVEKPKALFGVRHLQVLLQFLLTFIAYGIRVNLSVAVVAMTTKTSENPDIPIYHWNDKSIVLSSFFWGYIIPQVGAGQLAKRYGPKWFLVITMSICSLFSILLPAMANSWGSEGVMLSRALQGFCQGFIFPSIHNLLSLWVPVSERSRLGTFVYAGGPLGTVVSMIVSGLISASWYGWPMVFYLYGTIGLIWVLVFALIGANKPKHSRCISEEENLYLEASIGTTNLKAMRTPWVEMITSKAVWAILIAHCGQNWGFWTLMTEIPTYMSEVMNFQIKKNSYLSALPYFVLWILSFLFSALTDFLIVRKYTSIGTARKLLNTIGLVVPAIALVFLGFMDAAHYTLAIVLLVIAVGINSAIYSGYNVNHMDISPNHSGTLMGITNCISNICSLLAPLFVQVVVTDEKNTSQWQVVFGVSAIIYVLSDVVFVWFGSGKVQDWNDVPKEATNQKYTTKTEDETDKSGN